MDEVAETVDARTGLTAMEHGVNIWFDEDDPPPLHFDDCKCDGIIIWSEMPKN